MSELYALRQQVSGLKSHAIMYVFSVKTLFWVESKSRKRQAE